MTTPTARPLADGVPPSLPDSSAIPKVRLDATGHLDEDILCRKCGYNLRTLSPEGRCPECGTAVGRSMLGDFLRFADPDWVRTLASGMNWITAAVAIGFFLGCGAGGMMGGLRTGPLPIQIVSMGVAVLALVGYWKVTMPDPSGLGEEAGINSRQVVRVMQVARLAQALLILFLLGPSTLLGHVFAILGELLGLVHNFAVFIYAGRMAKRIPDDKLVRNCRIVMWGLTVVHLGGLAFHIVNMVKPFAGFRTPATITTSAPTPGVTTTVVSASGSVSPRSIPTIAILSGCVVGPASIVFFIWALRLIDRFRKAFKEAAAQATATWAAGQGIRRQALLDGSSG